MLHYWQLRSLYAASGYSFCDLLERYVVAGIVEGTVKELPT
jgi:hypothetical protein